MVVDEDEVDGVTRGGDLEPRRCFLRAKRPSSADARRACSTACTYKPNRLTSARIIITMIIILIINIIKNIITIIKMNWIELKKKDIKWSSNKKKKC